MHSLRTRTHQPGGCAPAPAAVAAVAALLEAIPSGKPSAALGKANALHTVSLQMADI